MDVAATLTSGGRCLIRVGPLQQDVQTGRRSLLQIRAVSLKAYLEVASFLGIDGLEQLATAGIRPGDLHDPEQRIPADRAVGLLERSASAAQCPYFAILMAECRSFASLGPVSLLFQHLATVGEVVSAIATVRRSLSDVLLVELDHSDDLALITFDLTPPFSRPQAVDLTVALGLLTLRGASGGRWAPETVHFTHKRPADTGPFVRYFRAPLQFDSVFNGLSCSRTSLDITLPLADPAMAQNAARLLAYQDLPSEHSSLPNRVRRSIALLLPSGRATMEEVAANVGLNARSFQRVLRSEKRTFASLLDEVRRERARHYLADSTMRVAEIAEQLGYATPTSFTRWFTAEFGISPRLWRTAEGGRPKGPPPMWKV